MGSRETNETLKDDDDDEEDDDDNDDGKSVSKLWKNKEENSAREKQL